MTATADASGTPTRASTRPTAACATAPGAQRHQPGAVSAGPRRHAGDRRRRGDGVPRQPGLVAWRLSRCRGLLRHLRLPDHAALDLGEGAHLDRRHEAVLDPTGSATPPGAVHDDDRAHDLDVAVRTRRARQAPRRRDRCVVLRVELVPDLDGCRLHRGERVRAAAAPLESRRRGTVLRRVAARDVRAASRRVAADRRHQSLAGAGRARHHPRHGAGVHLGSDRDAGGDPGCLLVGVRT